MVCESKRRNERRLTEAELRSLGARFQEGQWVFRDGSTGAIAQDDGLFHALRGPLGEQLWEPRSFRHFTEPMTALARLPKPNGEQDWRTFRKECIAVVTHPVPSDGKIEFVCDGQFYQVDYYDLLRHTEQGWPGRQ